MASYVSGLFDHSNTNSVKSGDFSSLQSSNYEDIYGGTIENVLKYSYLNNLHTDIECRVHCGDSYISFQAHKLVLSLRSSVLAERFFGSNKITGKVIEITDVPPSAFEALLKHCYGFNEELLNSRKDTSFVLKVYKAASIYDVHSLQVFCSNLFNSATPTVDNVFELLDAAVLANSESLKLRCFKVLQQRTAEIMSSRDVFSMTPAVINTILDMPTLSLNSEYELLTWLFEWGSYNCIKNPNKKFQDIMAPYLPQVNFTSLTPQEFGMLVKKYRRFFKEQEAFSIFMKIACPDCDEELPTWCQGGRKARSYNPNALESL